MTHYQNHKEIMDLYSLLTDAANRSLVADSATITLAGNEPPWQPTGLTVAAGQAYSIFARGKIQWSAKYPSLYGEPPFHVWARIHPGGMIVNLTASSGSFTADVDGALELGIYMGMWQDEAGSLTNTDGYHALSGEIEVAVVTWRCDSPAGLNQIICNRQLPALLVGERIRLEHESTPPTGWSYLPETGYSEMYRRGSDRGNDHIEIEACNDQGIIRFPVDIPLQADTKLEWRWRVDEHPSVCREDRAACHDYISIGTEFDNGRDLTWIWSQYLDKDVHFHCPVRAWTARETHYVVRTADDRLGEWCADARSVFDDVAVSQGTPPQRIVAIWLITVCTFSHRRARARFANITIGNAVQQRKIL